MHASVPFAFVGGRLILPSLTYRVVVGVLLLCAAWRLYRATTQLSAPVSYRPMSAPAALLAGLLAGLTGAGGGLLLGPLLIFAGWAGPRQAAGVSAVFILLNSTAALLGNAGNLGGLPSAIVVWAPAAAAGDWIGATYGSRRLAGVALRRILAIVLVLAATRMIWQ
ncbi:MAG: TSUP family transporter [Candidatus Roseilinea sp.]|uniref:TSUP family transporter n=1 Tax=Candidatus Roseilinea sp. TaxID=2838777 RepID=UPI00404AC89E